MSRRRESLLRINKDKSIWNDDRVLLQWSFSVSSKSTCMSLKSGRVKWASIRAILINSDESRERERTPVNSSGHELLASAGASSNGVPNRLGRSFRFEKFKIRNFYITNLAI